MPKEANGELVPVVQGFDYAPLEPHTAKQVRETAERIRERVKRTVQEIIETGEDLLAAKEALPHGQFGKWLLAEFGWAERTARNFMSVAEQFGKSANFAELPIQPSAAYLLAAPSAPDEARQVAIEKAEAGEEITFAAAKVIVAEARKKSSPRKKRSVPANKLGLRLVKVLERYKERMLSDDQARSVD